MPRKLNEIIAHIRAVSANPTIRTTLIQTEDLEALCAAAEDQRLVDAIDKALVQLIDNETTPIQKIARTKAILEDALEI